MQTQSLNGENRKSLFVAAAQEMMFPAGRWRGADQGSHDSVRTGIP
jgi:hypothetical protein